MTRVRLDIAYDGSDFCGWQVQPGERSVQGVLEEALAVLGREPLRLHSSGRTDAGVHARQMVAHFDVARPLPLTAYREGLNSLLPDDVAVQCAALVGEDFHARFSARDKWYRYAIDGSAVRHPLRRRDHWHCKFSLDPELMRSAGQQLVGEHDFVHFRASGCAALTTVRRIDSVEISLRDRCYYIDVRGSGFLRHMVRRISGCLVDIGRGRAAIGVLDRLLRGEESTYRPLTAPAHGLCLMEVRYDEGGNAAKKSLAKGK